LTIDGGIISEAMIMQAGLSVKSVACREIRIPDAAYAARLTKDVIAVGFHNTTGIT
jgi:hypothetical protein